MVERYTGGDAETEAQWAAIFEPVGRMGSAEEVAEAAARGEDLPTWPLLVYSQVKI